MNISDEREILKKRLMNKKHRNAFVSAYIDETIPFQIRALREQDERGWTQEELASHANMKQERISTLENPNYASYSLRILKQLAAAFDVALIVRFVPFGELAEWKLNLSSKSLEVPSFNNDRYFQAKKEASGGYNQYTKIPISKEALKNVFFIKDLERKLNIFSPKYFYSPITKGCLIFLLIKKEGE